MHTILTFIEASAAAHPDLPAIRHRKHSITFRELATGIDRVARHAIAAGAAPGDRFLFAARPSPTSLTITLGLLRAGLTLVFVDPFTSPDLFASRAQTVRPRYTLADAVLYTLGHRRLAPARRWKNVSICDYSAVEATHLHIGRRLPGVPPQSVSMNAWLTTSAPDVGLPELDPGADAVITFTSGTTSDPKGVVHTLATLSSNVEAFADALDLRHGQQVYSEPMTVGAVALARAATWHIPHRRDRIPDADVYFGVPTDVLDLLDRVDRSGRTPKIRTVATGAAPVLPSLVTRVSRTFGEATRILNVYGMTEMLPVAVGDARRKLETVRGDLLGSPIGDTRIRIAADNEIVVTGSGLMDRYFGRERAEWHATGDYGELTEDGELIMLGRKKNMLIRRDQNIYPSLYEPAITVIHGVADAAIVGVPDEYGDDVVYLFIVPEPGHDTEAVRLRVIREAPGHMDAEAIPDHVIAIPAMPVTGRARKRDMQALVRLATEHGVVP